ncbi:MAG: putative ABC transporter permease [Chloroflexi bacterium]|nr:putative ABC transporter permease [Chloroflexota bacterium]
MPIELRFLVYGMLGWSGEIIWTAIRKKVTGQAKDWLLMGDTSLWSFPLYGSIAFLFEPVHNWMRPQFILVRALVYLVGFWGIEYLGGWLIWKITRLKPWDYSKSPGGSLNGLIRWNFVLVWPLVGLLFEQVHDLLMRISL